MTAAVPVAARRVGDALRAKGAARSRVVWPSLAWRGRHIEFARDVLGKRTFASHQRLVMDEYYSRPRIELAVCTGQKKGKTETLNTIILFDYATEPALNGFIYGPKIEWVDEALWPRLAQDAQRAYLPCAGCRADHERWCAIVETDPLDETPRPAPCAKCSPLLGPGDELDPKSSESGLRAADGRVVRGYTSRKLGGKGGLSGKVRFWLDESSDIEDATRESAAGNMSGGGKLAAFGNLLYPHGWFARAFKSERSRYDLVLQISSRLSPNCRGRIEWSDGAVTEDGRWLRFPNGAVKRPEGLNDYPLAPTDRPVRGMADREGVEANLRAWRGTVLIAARIDAIPPDIVEGQIASTEVVTAAEQRWTPEDDQSGVLQFGVDVGRARDPLAIAERRGKKVRRIYAEVLGERDHARGVEILLDVVATSRRPHERPPRIVFDETGDEGQKFGRELQHQLKSTRDPRLQGVEVIAIQFGFPPRNRKLYDKRRDELAINCISWMKSGGAIPPDGELEAEIDATTVERVEVSYGQSGMKWEVSRVISNDDMRLIIGRSPNKFDAVKLAVLDLDGDDTAANGEPAATQIPTASRTSPAIEAAPPVDDAQGSVFAQQDALYGAIWGQR